MNLKDILDTKFRTGDWVEVKNSADIAETLDTDGTLDGLPFMPEMLGYCGRRFRVMRRAEKSCVEYPDMYRIREFRNNDVVILEGLRCSGASHDGCQRSCTLFWKEAWLSKVQTGQSVVDDSQSERDELCANLKTKVSPMRYFCQSTELANATMPLTRGRILLKCLYDVRSGSRGVLEMLWLILAPFWRKATRKFSRPRLAGALKRTPVDNLNLQPGEVVEIKSADQITQTLDTRGRNRGLVCDYGMSQYAGCKYRVRSRLGRMISETTGEMRKMESTVILEGLECLCWNTLGGCPRQDFMYWREIWLKRIEEKSGNSKMLGVLDFKAKQGTAMESPSPRLGPVITSNDRKSC